MSQRTSSDSAALILTASSLRVRGVSRGSPPHSPRGGSGHRASVAASGVEQSRTQPWSRPVETCLCCRTGIFAPARTVSRCARIGGPVADPQRQTDVWERAVPLLLTRHETRERVPRGPSFAWSSEHFARVFISLGWPDPRWPLKLKAGVGGSGRRIAPTRPAQTHAARSPASKGVGPRRVEGLALVGESGKEPVDVLGAVVDVG